MPPRTPRDRRSSSRRDPKRNRDVGTGAEADRLIAVVGTFPGRRVVVLGDLVADEFVYGDIARISREAPVPILAHRRTVVVPGGGGNAVVNLRALGARPLPVGVVGRDGAGRRLLEEFRRAGIVRGGIHLATGYDTPCKSRILAGGVHTRRQQIVRVDRGGGRELPRSARAAVRRNLRRALPRADGLLVADYGYGAATPDLLDGLAAVRDLPVLVDSRERVAAYRRATGCTPNQEELERALGLEPLRDRAAVEMAGRRLLRRTGNRAVLVTRGARGMCLFERRRSPVHIPAFGSDEVADVTGAGDTVIAVFTLALLGGAGFVDACRLANYAAGRVVMKSGTASVTAQELIAAVREDLQP
jgi:rfaE bifunctional protein kinase chain/domain